MTLLSKDQHFLISGMVSGFLAVSFVAIIAGFEKYLVVHYSVIQVVWTKDCLLFFGLIFFLAQRRLPLSLSDRPFIPLARGVLMLVADLLMVLALKYLPLAQAVATTFISPILLMMLSILLLGERVKRGQWIAALCGFLGVLIVLQPGEGVWHWAAPLPVGVGLCVALWMIFTKILSRESMFAPTLLLMTLPGLALTSFVVPFVWKSPPLEGWILMIALTFSYGLMHYLWMRALAHVPASTLAPVVYTRVIAAAAIGFLVFDEVPTFQMMIGTLIVVVSGLYSCFARSAAVPLSRE